MDEAMGHVTESWYSSEAGLCVAVIIYLWAVKQQNSGKAEHEI